LINEESSKLQKGLRVLEVAVPREVEPLTSLGEVIQLIAKNPEHAEKIEKAYTAIIDAVSDRQRRKLGVWIGAALSLLFTGGGTVSIFFNGPLLVGMSLYGLAAFTIGAMFVTITGRSVDIKDLPGVIKFRSDNPS
jgi:hypothetical protein